MSSKYMKFLELSLWCTANKIKLTSKTLKDKVRFTVTYLDRVYYIDYYNHSKKWEKTLAELVSKIYFESSEKPDEDV
jgi:hypothetical protein